jgi:hypothetical protein
LHALAGLDGYAFGDKIGKRITNPRHHGDVDKIFLALTRGGFGW